MSSHEPTSVAAIIISKLVGRYIFNIVLHRVSLRFPDVSATDAGFIMQNVYICNVL